ncbi:hypothetical protein K3495_g15334 [Podosphaera aphanis]|nr:hypothetical protein K3495_g15334 [Podosphaera aphanis]
MDFCSFPKDQHGYDNVLVFVDRLSKQCISVPCAKSIDSRDMAKLYVYHIYRYFGPPITMTSDRGPQFISSFWKAFNAILGTRVQLSTADHPETDGQTEIYNQYLEQRLRPFCNYYQDNWSELLPMMDYAQLTLPHASLGGLLPYEILHGFKPRTSFDWQYKFERPGLNDKVNVQDAQRYATHLQKGFDLAKNLITKAQDTMRKNRNKHRRAVDFDVGDWVFLDSRHLKTQRPMKKLDNVFNGPFKIIEKVGHSFRLQLPVTMAIHNVFSPDKLRKDPQNPLPGQLIKESPPVNITGTDEWEVKHILAVKKIRQTLFYRAHWLNQDEDLTWYPASNYKYAPHMLRDFHLRHPDLPGPPARLMEWIKAWDEGVDNYEMLEGNRPMDTISRTRFFQGGGVM